MNKRQRHWLELIKDTDLDIQYHEGKANVVVHAFTRKLSHGVIKLLVLDELYRDRKRLNLKNLEPRDIEAKLNVVTLESLVFDEIKESQFGDKKLDKIKEKIQQSKEANFKVQKDGNLRYKGR